MPYSDSDNQNYIPEEVRIRLNLGNAYYIQFRLWAFFKSKVFSRILATNTSRNRSKGSMRLEIFTELRLQPSEFRHRAYSCVVTKIPDDFVATIKA